MNLKQFNIQHSKFNILVIAFALITATTAAQDIGLPPREMTKTEIARWSQVCEWLSRSLPVKFKDYTVKQDQCGAFEWAEMSKQRQPLTVINKKNEPIGNQPNFNAWYTMNEDSADLKRQQMDVEVVKAIGADGKVDQAKFKLADARSEKFNQCKNLSVHVRTNVKMDLAKQYEISTKPVKLDLPIAAFAFLYTFPEGKTVEDEEGAVGTDGIAYYKDKAVIIISSKPPKVVASPECKCTWKEDKIFPQDNATEVSTALLKNIVVEIDGNITEVKEMIKLIDWKSLQAQIGK